ncbi:MAG: ATP-binding protein [Ignavibacteria bacterium]|nr:ATP-binding protein [Ignavibacteria bacterium]
MKRINLLTKYSVIFLAAFLISFIFLSRIIDVSNETLLVYSVFSFVFYLITMTFIYKEVNMPLNKIFNLSGQLKLRDEDYDSPEYFDSKISELNNLMDDLEKMKSGSVLNKEIFRIINEIHSIAGRTLHELETAKVFKINRNEFMGNVAHELRTPIFAIQLSLETLIDGAINDEEVNMDFLKRAFNQTSRLKELVDDLISISKFETGVKMSKRYFRISNVIQKTAEELRALAGKKNIEIKIETSDDPEVTVFGDEQRLQQVLVNLIDNAIKYTAGNGSICISQDIKEKEVIVRIEDSGIGIPQKDLKRIFERFYRVDKTRSRDIGGSGLGLSIVKHILEAHSSRINVESEINKGTKFEFSLKR